METINAILIKLFGGSILFLAVWFLHLIPIGLIGGPCWYLGRNRVQWSLWDYSIIFVPFVVWATLMFMHDPNKTLANLSSEGILIGLVASFAPLLRIIIRDRLNQNGLAIGLLVCLCLFAIGLWAFVPALPE